MPPHSRQRTAWEALFRGDLAAALGVSPSRIVLLTINPEFGEVQFDILPPYTLEVHPHQWHFSEADMSIRTGSTVNLIDHLQAQLNDPTSPLRSGSMTREFNVTCLIWSEQQPIDINTVPIWVDERNSTQRITAVSLGIQDRIDRGVWTYVPAYRCLEDCTPRATQTPPPPPKSMLPQTSSLSIWSWIFAAGGLTSYLKLFFASVVTLFVLMLSAAYLYRLASGQAVLLRPNAPVGGVGGIGGMEDGPGSHFDSTHEGSFYTTGPASSVNFTRD